MDERPDAALLDLDGTLIDTNYQHAISWNEAFGRCGLTVPASTVHGLIGMGSDRFVAEVAGEAWDREHGERARDLHRELFRAYEPRALPGAGRLVESLLETGMKVAVASSANPDDLRDHLSRIGIDVDRLSATVSAHHVDASKPDPAVFQEALEQLDCHPDAAFVVGDTVWDIRAARAAGLPTMAVLTGGIARCELVSEGACAVFEDAGDLADRLEPAFHAIAEWRAAHVA